MFGYENRGASFGRNNDHFDFSFSLFWCTKNFNGDYFVLRINKMIHPKQKIGCFIHFSIFPALFLRQISSFTLYRVAYKWRMDRIRGHASATFEFSPNFSQVYIEFCQSLFSVSERLTYFVLKCDNFKSVEVQGWTPLKILIFLHWTLRPTFTTLLGKRRAISHWMGVPKNRGKCSRPPYRYTAVTHWACPLSSG